LYDKVKDSERRVKLTRKNSIKTIVANCLFGFSTAELFALRWARTQYPMHKAYNVFFVVKSDTKGHDSGTLLSFCMHIILPTILVCVVVRLISLLFDTVYKRIYGRRPVTYFNNIKKHLQLNIVYVVSATLFSVFMLKAWKYPLIFYEVHKKPVPSVFYEKNYVDPRNVSVTFPDRKRNLIVIFMESMESSYASIADGGVFDENLIPGLTSLGQQNINFSETSKLGGGENLEGTSWTAAGMISKLGGVPYFSPFFKQPDGKKTCLSGVVFLTDILAQSGYKNIFSIGSDKQFESRDIILEDHHTEVHDINWYKKHGEIPPDYHVFWGFEDEKLFAITRKELTDLGSGEQPFFYGMLTVDTHFPDGYKSRNCPKIFKRQIMNVIRYSDTQICSLIDWIQKQSWYENTTIVIMGDHNFLNAPDNNFIVEESPLPDAESQRRWLDIIINSVSNAPQFVQKNRQFSPYDMYPTMLESIGCTIKGHALGFGRSLYTGNKTLVEQYGADTVNTELMRRTVEYEALKK